MAWGIFNNDSAEWTEVEAVEADFYSREEAEAAIASRYSEEDELVVHEIELPEDDEDEDDPSNPSLEEQEAAGDIDDEE